MPLTPKNRKEEWLQGLVDHETTLTPKNRPEAWMKDIIDASGGGGGGGGGGTFIVTDTGGTLNKTYAEIKAAFDTGKVVMCNDGGAMYKYLYIIGYEEGVYGVGFFADQENSIYTTDTESGYPISQ